MKSKTLSDPKSHLPEVFYTSPEHASTIFTRAQLKETLLYTGGFIMACGTRFDIATKHLGVGVYSISLKQHVYNY